MTEEQSDLAGGLRERTGRGFRPGIAVVPDVEVAV